jgi:predicted nuclease of restriction endonuclease-like (RecB) superfamily
MDITLQSGEYKDFLSSVKSEIQQAQIKAMVKVNKELTLLYWNIGKQICEKQEAYQWGDKMIEALSKDLQKEFPNSGGYARRNLFYMKKFYLAYTDIALVQSVTALISWTHNVLLLDRIKDAKERLWYAENSIKYGWSVRVLDHQIDAQQYERSGKSINNFDTTLPAPQSELARDILKDPYNFDFLTLEKDYAEKDLEEALVKHITNFLLELGVGFAFVGRQYVVTVDDTDYKIDLLFYHLKLRCYVVIELKAKDFQPEFAGKLNFYINVIDGEVKDKIDNPTIGILLCKNKGGNTKVEYSLKNINAPIGISGYNVNNALPTIETLQRELENVIIENEKEQESN